jgi:hypothetical protein
MPLMLNAEAVIMCVHGGRVVPIPSQTLVLIEGTPALRLVDLVGAPVVGCPLPWGHGTKPCTATIAPLPGSWSLTVEVVGGPALLATATGMTNSFPPGTFGVRFPGQLTVQA